MIRILFEYVVPVLVPFAVYFGWTWLVGHRAGLREAPWFWLSAASLVLLTASLVAMALTTGETPDGVYHPPVYKNGKIIPGHIERPTAK